MLLYQGIRSKYSLHLMPKFWTPRYLAVSGTFRIEEQSASELGLGIYAFCTGLLLPNTILSSFLKLGAAGDRL